jgi:hypothetical protein
MSNNLDQIIRYKHKDGRDFKFKQQEEGKWKEVKVGDILYLSYAYYEVIEIKSNEVTLKRIPDKVKEGE